MRNNEKVFKFSDIIKSFRNWPRIFNMLWSVDKKYVIVITILSVISGFIPTVSILLTQSLINAIQTSNIKKFQYVLVPFMMYIIINFIGSSITQIMNYFQGAFKLKLTYKLGLIILEKAEKFNLREFEDSEIYDKLRRAQNEVGERPYIVFSLMLNFTSQLISLISSGIILIMWNPWVLLLVLIIPVISSMYMMRLGHVQYKIQWERASGQRKLWYMNYILTNDIAFKEVKLYKLAPYFIEGFKRLSKKFISQDKGIIVKQTKLAFIFDVLDELVGAIVCLLVIKSAYIGEILLGNTIAYIRCVSNIQTNTQGILTLLSNMYQNNLFIEQLFEFLDLPIDKNKGVNELINIREINSIEFKNVYFKYNHRKEYALKDVSFKIYKGENIALVGQNGSGKTTLVKLISGFYDDYEGEILINGISSHKIDKESIRDKIGVVFQDYNKYELTCRENIAFGNLDMMNNDKKLFSAIQQAYATELVESLPNGVDTQLGVWFEEGVQLSGGQWQKIALSRAFLREADCYILDEPSSALDPFSEHELFKKSYELTKDKIGIFITHRLFNIKKLSSRILVLNNGQIIEEGTHEELMCKNNYYKFLYTLQNSTEYNVNTKNMEVHYGTSEEYKVSST